MEDEQTVNESKETFSKRRSIEDDDTRRVLSTDSGKRFVWSLLMESGVDEDFFNQNALIMANFAGRRSTGLYVKNRIFRACPEMYEQMRQIAATEQTCQKKPKKA